MPVDPRYIRLMDLFVNNEKVQAIRDDPKKCQEAWVQVCASVRLPPSDYAETLRDWFEKQKIPKGDLRISASDADGMVRLLVPAPVEGGFVVHPVQVRTLLAQVLTAYASRYTDPVRFLHEAQAVARTIAARVLSPPEPK